MHISRTPLAATLLLAASTSQAFAYVGPGLAGSLASVVMAILGVIGLIAAALFARPVLYLVRKGRKGQPADETDRQHQTSD